MESGSWHIEERTTLKDESFVDVDKVPETGCLSIVVLGASGDLAKKKTFPALYNLFRQVLLDSCLTVCFIFVNYIYWY